MMIRLILICFSTLGLLACQSAKEEAIGYYPDIKIAGAMKNVMWKGELGGVIQLDTIEDRKGLYGIGPLSYLKGELLINDGQAYVSKVVSDSSMTVEKTFDASAPFFVYGNVQEWQKIDLPVDIKNIAALETFVNEKTNHLKRPFAFKLDGEVVSATIHIQNLADSVQVSSPAEAHQGQNSYHLVNEVVEIIGFFSTEHQGVFTHHDSFLHLHLITKDESKMGHLDEVEFDRMSLYLPLK